MTVSSTDEGPKGLAAVLRYVRELTAHSSRAVTLTLALGLGAAVSEGLCLLLLLPLLEMVGVTVGEGVAGDLAAHVTSRLEEVGPAASLSVVLVLYATIMAARAQLVRFSVITCVRLQEQFLLAYRRRLYRAMLGSRWDFVAGRRAGSLTHSLTGELEDAANAPSDLFALVTGTLLAVVYLGLAFRLSVPITIVGAAGGAGVLLVLRRQRAAARRAGEKVHELTAVFFGDVAEHVDGLKTTKAYAAEGSSARIFSEQSAAVADANERSERKFADARAMLDSSAVVVLALSVYVAHDVMNLGAPAILVLLYIFGRVTSRLAGLQNSYQRLLLAMPPFMRAARAIDRWEAAAEAAPEDGNEMPLRRALTFRDVRYQYYECDEWAASRRVAGAHVQSTRPPALRGATLTIAAGATTAVVGPSGAGKTTLADVALGLLFAQGGRVEVDGVELTPARARAWRERVGYVAQETYLFNDTIRANLCWACPEATDESIWAALALAAADRFVAALPNGLDTIVGERGCRLSCGERQRLTLARALVRRPVLLLLDEATSSVDAEHDREIQRAVESLRGQMTMLVITHRLATVRAADVIYVMDSGRIIESGNFEELVRRRGRFASLCHAQGVAVDRGYARASREGVAAR